MMGTGEENGRKDASVRVSPMWKKVVGFAARTSVFYCSTTENSNTN